MKKVIVMLSLFAVLFAGKVSAQRMELENTLISSVTMKEGANSMLVKVGSGTLTFMKRGETFSNVVYTDPAGKATRLEPTKGGADNLPKPACKFPLPDACFGAPSENIGMCICRPTDIAGSTYTVSLLLPAVQKVREASNRMRN